MIDHLNTLKSDLQGDTAKRANAAVYSVANYESLGLDLENAKELAQAQVSKLKQQLENLFKDFDSLMKGEGNEDS